MIVSGGYVECSLSMGARIISFAEDVTAYTDISTPGYNLHIRKI